MEDPGSVPYLQRSLTSRTRGRSSWYRKMVQIDFIDRRKENAGRERGENCALKRKRTNCNYLKMITGVTGWKCKVLHSQKCKIGWTILTVAGKIITPKILEWFPEDAAWILVYRLKHVSRLPNLWSLPIE